MFADLDDKVTAALGAIDQRYSSGRQSLVHVLQKAKAPVGINEIAKADKKLPQSSIYRNLTVLEEAGVVRRVMSGGEFERFELSDDLAEHHHHVICENCGKVADIDLPSGLEHELHETEPKIARKTGFQVANHRVDFFGLCPTCRV